MRSEVLDVATTVEQRAIAARLGRARHFRTLPSTVMRALVQNTRIQDLDAGESLWRAGDDGAHVTLIDRGAVMIATPRPNGGVAVLGVFGPDDCVGTSAVVARSAYPADAIALGPGTRGLAFPAAVILDAINTHMACAELVRAILLDHTAALRMKIEIMSAGSAPARLAAFLLHLADRFGQPHPTGGVRVPIAVSRTQLAQVIAARPETVIRTFSAWHRARIVTSDREGFELKAMARLHAVAHGD